ncbi:flotillin family protein [Aquibacillus koreensis]|uniref:Flotillin family protein n=1 Tax=Aquibacillus koreensis TaxID=279446 RepID=A0A9X3WP21_9BACI|nr:flotillin family protein [Aquibacillus koreensis]MCT2536194.1 flotillin family protein [Aquibacillus koreensis]MDC3422118.1 flotillin family protein [Aquibacillus koreensis]
MTDLFIIIGVIVAVILAFTILFAARYKTVGADDAMIVTGSFLGNKNVHKVDGSGIKIVRGGGAFILPIFQQYEKLSLRSHSLDISTPNVYTENGVPVMANGTAIIKVQSTTEGIATAAEQFLGKDNSELQKEAQEVLEGHLRAILGTMTVEEIYKNRERFAQEVQTQAAVDLKKMGLQIVSFTIKDVQDENGYLEALGKPRISEVKRDAQIAEANAMRDARIKKAEAEREGKSAEILSETQIAEATKDKELKIAAYKRDQDTARAEADMAYKLQGAKSEQQVKQEEMQIRLVEKNKQIEIDEKEVIRKQRQYEAEISKKAEAERYATEQRAEADKVTRVKQAEAEAAQIRLDGEAEAEAIRLKGFAEAEAKEKLADAMAKYGEAAILEMIIKMLPEFAGKIAEPVASIDKITVVDSGNGSGDGATRVSNYVTKLMSQLPETLKDVSGVDLKGMLDNVAAKSETRIKDSLAKAESKDINADDIE